ncbi:hypothetical protein BDN70DRAFT_931837 [Pholiota conissans]|uniref:Uncharacterized protein n=1 Tax=Pholiota conissans TaxID=109636 RepID=A0A9P5Z3Q6_9AGAR|nr:hypothetical protein BDN70DRAFT_931837 [Pholiota conissans]
MSTPISNVAPAEIIDLVVDAISQFQDKETRISTLASVALVSWYCRHRAHARLFSNLFINNATHTWMRRIRNLSRLIEADTQSEVSGVASYIRSFSVQLDGSMALIRAPLDNGTLASILRKIFKTKDTGPRSLKLSFFPRGSLGHRLDWTTLNANFLSAFHGLSSNPMFTTLHLEFFSNVPRTLLHKSFVKNVRLGNVELADDIGDNEKIPEEIQSDSSEGRDFHSRAMEGQAVPLESIEIDPSFPLLRIIDMTPQQALHPSLAFSHLKFLTTHVNSIEEFHKMLWILGNAAFLESLRITVSIKDYYLPEPDLRTTSLRLIQLKTISVVLISPSFKNTRTSILQICAFMNHLTLHPNLEAVDIFRFLHISRNTSPMPDQIFDGHEFHLLDRLFSQARFGALKRLTITLWFDLYTGCGHWDRRAFEQASQEYLLKLFALTTESHTALAINFQLDVRLMYE